MVNLHKAASGAPRGGHPVVSIDNRYCSIASVGRVVAVSETLVQTLL